MTHPANAYNTALQNTARLVGAALVAGGVSQQLRSSIVRGAIQSTEKLTALGEELGSDVVVGELGLITFDVVLGNSLVNEIQTSLNGQCISNYEALSAIVGN